MTTPATAPTLEIQRTLWVWCGVYVSAWISGLLVGAPDITPADSSAAVAEAYATSPSVLVNAALVHGLAAVALYGMSTLLGSQRLRRATRGAGLATLVLSLIQLAGEALLTFGLASDGSSPLLGLDSGQVWATIQVVDGIKMLALAALVLVVLLGQARRPVWATLVSGATILALLASAAGFLTLSAPLMTAAYVALPLLLIWAVVAALRFGTPAAVPGDAQLV
ncbi:hypothetical protein C5E07_18225 [Pseudoclavibacter sp. RFBJ3]|uniref:hypothetical protein n=1 Tax=unclassified Pseudoclavibacter TaxID=2615177 RepID=UPI000CE85C01|nr:MULTISPECIES: hypothetical protein [unclassified Pseudoclavibacter]PPF80194.1 hypothetical protein C5C12_18165 [Pseudoclavibacter sp. RFBJ5]PPF89168.1 hypothetical protein C5E07_18225 [Pseudoclavibacter sp. RFBJ3]PPF95793.1 hypothetical protein C5C19_17425 [Pseudoclavibacter sp. RFBH5]PPG25944.1 hypothetical protein C5E13_01070 [Pseudoclavibacter sp. RFBI4]